MKPYVVRQGDYLTKLAYVHGFAAAEVWDHPKNHELKALRDDMDVLCPGDLLYIPAEPPAALPLASQSANAYRTTAPRIGVSVAFVHDGAPLANAAYRVEGLAAELGGTSDGSGKVSFEVPVGVRQVRVLFPEANVAFPVRVGDLDPVDERSGLRTRLAQLGFYPVDWLAALVEAPDPDGDGAEEATEEALDRFAVAAFQEAHGLAATGEIDDATRAALVERHGS